MDPLIGKPGFSGIFIRNGRGSDGGIVSETEIAPPGVDPAVPSPARLYDYFLGGTHNFEADRDLAEQLRARIPDFVDAVLANRGFHVRAAAWMAGNGIRQFLDIGSGLPTVNNTHETVQALDRSAKVVYVDVDPIVGAHASDLLADNRSTALVVADMRDPEAVLASPVLRSTIDLSEPVGLMMTAVWHFVPDEQDPWGLVDRYLAALAPGSYLALSHGTLDRMPPDQIQAGRDGYARSSANVYMRPRADIERFFEGLEMQPPRPGAEPELTFVGLWGAEDVELADSDGSRAIFAGVARKP
jgi:S-adenosyl methyltransferase